MFEGLLGGFADVSTALNMGLLVAGTALGLVVGALPGLSSPMAIVVLLPLTFPLEPLPALLVMVGVYVGTKLGGSFSAILIRTPGTPAAACTALDGYPMAERGEAGLALGYATLSSTVGGIFSWVVVIIAIPWVSLVALKSSAADIALIGVAGLVMVSAFTRGSMIRGLIGVVLGVLIGSVGVDTTDSIERLTLGIVDLLSGVPLAAALVGLFGLTVVLSDLSMLGVDSDLVSRRVQMRLPNIREFFKRWKAWSIGASYGTLIGAVPGVGADGATWLSYATVKNKSPNPEEFGTGVPEGVIAPETSNNATTGGTMVPMLTLGIPGDASTAVMIGALYLHGLQPGVTLFETGGAVVYGVLAGLLLATVFMAVIAWASIGAFVFVLRQNRAWIFPFVMLFAMLGAYSSQNHVFPLYVAILLGVIGFILESRKFSVVTIVLGVILGPIVETNIRLALSLSDGDWLTFIDTGPRIALVALIIVLLANETRHGLKKPGRQAVASTGTAGD